MKYTETNQMTFATVEAFQSALLSKYYSINNMGSNPSSFDITVYQKLAVKDTASFFVALSHEIHHLISCGIITMNQAVSVGFDDSSLLID